NGLQVARPTVAVDAQGNGLVVWEEVAVARGFGFPQALGFSSFTPARGWSAPARFYTSTSPANGTISFDPRVVAVGNGSFVVAWQSGAHVLAARFDAATSFGPTQDLGPGGGPALAVNGSSSVIAAWHGSFDGETETNGILVSRLGGDGFSAPVRIDAPRPIDNRPEDPSVVLDAAGDATVVFGRSLDLVAVRLRAGQTIGDPETLLADHTRVNVVREAPAAGVDAAGRVVALWRQADGSGSAVQSLWGSRFVPGQGWSAPGPVDDGTASVSGYDLSVTASGDAFAAWSLDPAGDVRANRFTGGTWVPSVSLLLDAGGQSAAGAVGPPTLGVDAAGNAWAFVALAGSLLENRFAQGHWLGAATVQGTGQPQIAVASSGEAIVVLAPTDSRSVSAIRFVRSGN
ncbi:MAG TPA: hypothetical protein VMV21_10740, partial [Vicinamibacteria bacterium]|nr:hypothetical protein [Vicinamibacteria bacterium]